MRLLTAVSTKTGRQRAEDQTIGAAADPVARRFGFPYDVLQTAAEQFGMTDDTSRLLGRYLNYRLGTDQSLTMIVVAHSQGGAKTKQAFDLVRPDLRGRLYVITAAGAQVRGFPGAAHAYRVNKGGDLVCWPIGNASGRAVVARAITGETANDTQVFIPADSWWEYIAPWGLGNHGYETNYNARVARIIGRITGCAP